MFLMVKFQSSLRNFYGCHHDLVICVTNENEISESHVICVINDHEYVQFVHSAVGNLICFLNIVEVFSIFLKLILVYLQGLQSLT
jgi:hypothetical protein